MIETITSPLATQHPLWDSFVNWYQTTHGKDINNTPGHEWKPFWLCFCDAARIAVNFSELCRREYRGIDLKEYLP